MGLPLQAARFAGRWPNTLEPQRRPARRPTPSVPSRSTRPSALARVVHPFAGPARHA